MRMPRIEGPRSGGCLHKGLGLLGVAGLVITGIAALDYAAGKALEAQRNSQSPIPAPTDIDMQMDGQVTICQDWTGTMPNARGPVYFNDSRQVCWDE